MALPPSKPNPLHGKLPPEPVKEVSMPGAGPEPHMAEAPKVDDSAMHENTRAEMEAGRVALTKQDERTKAEMDAGRSAISRYPQPRPAIAAPVTQPE